MEKEMSCKILGIPSTATQGDIQKAFDFAMRKYKTQNQKFSSHGDDKRKIDEIFKAYRNLKSGREERLNDKSYVSKRFNRFSTKMGGMRTVIDENQNNESLVALLNSHSIESEQFRVLFSRIQSLSPGAKQKIVAVSSSVKGEGKTVTSMNLGITMAKDFNKKTLIIDGDLKKPDLHNYLKSSSSKGLIDVLLSDISLRECIFPFVFENLYVLPSWSKEENSTKLLSLPKMGKILYQVAKEFDYIIIDSPPVFPLADMNIFSKLVNGILFVVRAGMTPRDQVKKALGMLPPEKVLGIILNGAEKNISSYYGYPY